MAAFPKLLFGNQLIGSGATMGNAAMGTNNVANEASVGPNRSGALTSNLISAGSTNSTGGMIMNNFSGWNNYASGVGMSVTGGAVGIPGNGSLVC